MYCQCLSLTWHFLISSFTDKEFEQTSKTDENTLTKLVIKVKLWDFWVKTKVPHFLRTLIKHNYTLAPLTTISRWVGLMWLCCSQSEFILILYNAFTEKKTWAPSRKGFYYIFVFTEKQYSCMFPWNCPMKITWCNIWYSLVWAFHHW